MEGKLVQLKPSSMMNKMNHKLCLILFGAFIVLAVQSPDEESMKNSLSEEVTSERLRRSAYADSGKKRKEIKNKKAKKKNNKKSNKMQKAKKEKAKKPKKQWKQEKQKNSEKNSVIPESCLEESVQALYNGLVKKASNFERQVKRIEAYNKTITKKLEKAGDFKQASVDMKNIAPSCFYPLDQLAADILSAELGTCETNITDSCQPPEVNQTQIDECQPIIEAFKNETDVCFKLSNEGNGETACNCWEKFEFADLFESLSNCIITQSTRNVTERYRECREPFTACNKAQTKAFDVYVDCSKILECPEVGVSCINNDSSNVIEKIEFSTLDNCGKIPIQKEYLPINVFLVQQCRERENEECRFWTYFPQQNATCYLLDSCYKLFTQAEVLSGDPSCDPLTG